MSASRSLAVVVGAGGRIGAAIAARLDAHHRVALLDLDEQRLHEVSGSLPSGEALAFAIDCADASQVDAVFAELRRIAPIAAVAIAVGTTSGGSLDGLSVAKWNATIDSCLTSTFAVMRATVAGVGTVAGTGTVADVDGVAICVIGSPHAAHPQPGYPAYAVAKAGVVALARQVAAEYGGRGIRVNAVTPGWTRTDHTVSRLTAGDEARLLDSTPLRELAEPDDIAAAVAFLLSPDAHRISGADLIVDGGAALLGGATTLREASRGLLGLDPL